MPTEQLFLLTSTMFRLSIVAAGIFSTYLGYRLLLKGLGVHGGATEATAKMGRLQLSLRRLTPGTVFALFGMSLLVVMVHEGIPEYRDQTSPAASTLILRGPQDLSAAAFKQADELLKKGDLPAARRAYERSLEPLASATNNLAWTLLSGSHTEEAVVLSRFASAVGSENEDYLNTYAAALERTGLHTEAERVTARAKQLVGKIGAVATHER